MKRLSELSPPKEKGLEKEKVKKNNHSRWGSQTAETTRKRGTKNKEDLNASSWPDRI